MEEGGVDRLAARLGGNSEWFDALTRRLARRQPRRPVLRLLGGGLLGALLGAAQPGAAQAAPAAQATCSPRPKVGITTRDENGALSVTVTARGQGNLLRQVRFRRPINATIEIAGAQVDARSGYLHTIPGGGARFTFLLRPVAPGQSFHVALVVTDDCGEWPTFAGRGNGAAPVDQQSKQPCRPDALPQAVLDRCTDEAVNALLVHSGACRSVCEDVRSAACQACLTTASARTMEAFEHCKDALCIQTVPSTPPSTLPSAARPGMPTRGSRPLPSRSIVSNRSPSVSPQAVISPARCNAAELWKRRERAAEDALICLARDCAAAALAASIFPPAEAVAMPACVTSCMIPYGVALKRAIEDHGCSDLTFCTDANICCAVRQTGCGTVCCEDRCERCDAELQLCLPNSKSLSGTYTCSRDTVTSQGTTRQRLEIRMNGEPSASDFYPAVITHATHQYSASSTNCGPNSIEVSGTLSGGSTAVSLAAFQAGEVTRARLAHDTLRILATGVRLISYWNITQCVTEQHPAEQVGTLRCPDIEIPYLLHPNVMVGTRAVPDSSGGTYTISWDLRLKTACDE